MSDPIARLRELEAGATKKPWAWRETGYERGDRRSLFDGSGYLFGEIDDVQNGRFIASVRNALPALLDYVEALEVWHEDFDAASDEAVITARAALSRALGMEEPT